jgi:Tol biopolymer transport system component
VLLSREGVVVAHTVDGSAPDQVLIREEDRYLYPAQWLADGRVVYLSRSSSGTPPGVEIKLLEPGGRANRVLVPLGMGTNPDVSPDGRWLVYHSTQAGQTTNVVVQPFPGPGPRTQLSGGGGHDPAWSPDSKTVYYLNAGAVFAVDMVGSPLKASAPRELFRRQEEGCGPTRCYDISADGSRFLFREMGVLGRQIANRMDLVLNWTSTLPTGR